jgi:hypothetical protein
VQIEFGKVNGIKKCFFNCVPTYMGGRTCVWVSVCARESRMTFYGSCRKFFRQVQLIKGGVGSQITHPTGYSTGGQCRKFFYGFNKSVMY